MLSGIVLCVPVDMELYGIVQNMFRLILAARAVPYIPSSH